MNCLITRLSMSHYFLLSADNHRLRLQKPTTEQTCLPFALDGTFLTATFTHSCQIVSLLYLCSVFVTTHDVKKRGFDMQILSAHTHRKSGIVTNLPHLFMTWDNTFSQHNSLIYGAVKRVTNSALLSD